MKIFLIFPSFPFPFLGFLRMNQFCCFFCQLLNDNLNLQGLSPIVVLESQLIKKFSVSVSVFVVSCFSHVFSCFSFKMIAYLNRRIIVPVNVVRFLRFKRKINIF